MLSTRPMLAILEPMALPTARLGLCLMDAVRAMTTSGSDVPKAAIVSPIMYGDIPKSFAMDDAPKINLSALQISADSEIRNMMMSVSIVSS